MLNLKFNNSVLVKKKKKNPLCSNVILNLYKLIYIFYELNTWPRNSTNNFTLNIFLFGTVKLPRNTIKSKSTYNGCRIVFDGESSWNFDNDVPVNDVIYMCVYIYTVYFYLHKKQNQNAASFGNELSNKTS